MVLKLQHASEPSGGLLVTLIVRPYYRAFDSVGICLSNQFLNYADVTGLQTIIEESLYEIN